MRSAHTLAVWLGTIGLGTALWWGSPARAEAPVEQVPEQVEGVEVLARGPVHEAFAEPVTSRPQASPIVTKQPPDPVDETPPDQKPAGDDVQWIPGYWNWSDDQADFIWVSGFWRQPPPGRQWLPGHWQQVEDGWQWVSGFWQPIDQEEVVYVPPPPPSVDSGPSVPAPDDNSVYSPGCWLYRESRYQWRPGFWVTHRPDWVWIPAHYVWTTAGCLFVEGYWDHPLHERGLLFAPVRFDNNLLATANYSYVPQYVVQNDFLLSALFVRPSSHSYYFGDYFEDRYAQSGYVPWINYHSSRSSYDPNYSYYRHQFGEERGWERGMRQLYAARRSGEIERPPQTWVQQNQLVNRLRSNKIENESINKTINFTNMQNARALAPLSQINNTTLTNLSALARVLNAQVDNSRIADHPAHSVLKLENVPLQQRVQEKRAVEQIHAASAQRRQVETKLLSQGNSPIKPTDAPRAVKLNIPKPQAPVPAANRPIVRKTPPPPPAPPAHVERQLPQHEPLKPARPPQHSAAPLAPSKPAAPSPVAPLRREPAAPAVPPKAVVPPAPPRQTAPPAPHQATPPAPPKQAAPPAPPRQVTPPVPQHVTPPAPPKQVAPPAPPRPAAPPMHQPLPVHPQPAAPPAPPHVTPPARPVSPRPAAPAPPGHEVIPVHPQPAAPPAPPHAPPPAPPKQAAPAPPQHPAPPAPPKK